MPSARKRIHRSLLPDKHSFILPGKMNVLLTFTGFHDPFVETAGSVDNVAGPILSLISERAFDAVYLFATPRLAERTLQTQQAIKAHTPAAKVTILDVPLKDPTNYSGILRQLRMHFKRISRQHPEASYYIGVSSGTPHMHASWVLLVASGEIPARLLQSTPPEFVEQGKSRVREIDPFQSDFPHVSRSLEFTDQENEDAVLAEARQRLGIVGEDKEFLRVLREAYVYAQYDEHVLLLGETGTGKEQLANLIHSLGRRGTKPLISVNCSSIPENLAESQLFGHRKGSFTSASSDHEGKFKAADGSVIFLDELGDLPLNTQAKLLRTLDQGEIEPVGAPRPIRVDVKVVAATNRDLSAMIRDRTFRRDLFQRFSSIIRIPPLRQRRSDIPQLALYILQNWNGRYQGQRQLAPDALAELTRHNWPGNIRELRNVIQQSAMLTTKRIIRAADLRFSHDGNVSTNGYIPEPEEGFNLASFLDDLKARTIKRAMEKAEGVQARAAKLLGWTPQALNQYFKARESQRD
jgi:DNA-binding NtrC family response regulator